MPERRDHRGSPASRPEPSRSRTARQLPVSPAPKTLVAAASWLPAASLCRLEGNVGAILRSYRRAGGLTQQQLADMLGFDRTYISMIESGRRSITDRGHSGAHLPHARHSAACARHRRGGRRGLRRHARIRCLGYPAGRHRPAGGRAAEAVSELWPLITRLEARVASRVRRTGDRCGCWPRPVCPSGSRSGTCCPRSRWPPPPAGPAGHCASPRTSGPDLLAPVLRMHGNELRKAGHTSAGMTRLWQSLQVDDHPATAAPYWSCSPAPQPSPGRRTCSTGSPGSASRHSTPTKGTKSCSAPLPSGRSASADCSRPAAQDRRSTWRKVLRPAIGRPTPQWHVIERVTTADVLARAGDEHTAVGMLSAALSDAETLRLPHQVQRIIRLTDQAGDFGNPSVRMQAQAALTRLEQRLTEATPTLKTS